MSENCCKSETACCAPPPLVVPTKTVTPTVEVTTCGTVENICCPKGVPVFDGVDPRYKRVLWTVIAINGAMFVTEMAAGQLAGSQALKADALDFLADTVTYGLSLAVIGASHGGTRQGRLAVADGAVGVRVHRLPHADPRRSAGRDHGCDRRSGAGREPCLGVSAPALQGWRRQRALGVALLSQRCDRQPDRHGRGVRRLEHHQRMARPCGGRDHGWHIPVISAADPAAGMGRISNRRDWHEGSRRIG